MNALPPLLALLAVTAVEGDAALDRPPPVDPAITAGELRAHVEWLASDELRGREAGTEDARRAARYLARCLEASGLQPAGASFLQDVPLERWVHETAPELVVGLADGTRIRAAHGVDFDLFVRGEPRSTGALALLTARSLAELPESARPDGALFVDAVRRERVEWLDARGMGEAEGWGLVVRPGSKRPGRSRIAAEPRWRLADAEGRAARGAGTPDPGEVVRLRARLRELLEAGEIATLELRVDARRESVVDYNVLGIVPGAGTAEEPELAREVVLLSAHYDHLGVAAAAEPGADTVFNGADDNGSGTAAVLELAQALATGARPARTVMVLLAAGEEKGLLGTRWLLGRPDFEPEAIAANLNFEMVGRPDELAGGPGGLWLTGFERSNLGPAFRAAGLAIHPDARPEQRFFQRSDNYPLARLGVVAQSLSTFALHADYHQVTDEAATLDYGHMERAVEQALEAVRLLASGELDPAWLPDGNPAGG